MKNITTTAATKAAAFKCGFVKSALVQDGEVSFRRFGTMWVPQAGSYTGKTTRVGGLTLAGSWTPVRRYCGAGLVATAPNGAVAKGLPREGVRVLSIEGSTAHIAVREGWKVEAKA